jgi:hypothetical protein
VVGFRRHARFPRLVSAVLAALSVVVLTPATIARAGFVTGDRIDLKVLVVDDGSPWVAGLAQELATEGVAYTDVSLSSATRPTITAAFLASGTEAFYQAVIVPNETGGGLPAAEFAALTAYETQFGIRQVDAFTWANPAAGLNYASDPATTYIGSLDGRTATVTAAGKTGGFGYLQGPIPFDTGSYAYVSTPLSPLPAGATFSTLISAPVPNTANSGSIVGDYSHDGRDELVVTAAMSYYQFQFRTLAHGIVDWATHGVHLGYQRNYLTFHFDDVFNSNSTWDAVHHCTPGDDCPRNADGSSIYPVVNSRMGLFDVTNAVLWEQLNNFRITLPFNASKTSIFDLTTQAFVATKAQFDWLSHGYQHIAQGCVQNFAVIPWQCKTDPVTGAVQYVSQADIYNEIHNNVTAGRSLGLPFNASEYLSGEHSGLSILPQQPADNPNFAAALTQAGITSVGADASRQPVQRTVGSALTVPRHPTSLFFNAATTAQEVSEYNWLYTSAANGGSGICTANPGTTTCIEPLAPATGFQSYIVPTDVAIDLRSILNNDPRPFYGHQSNLAGDHIGLTLMSAILAKYRATYTPSTPVTSVTMTDAALLLSQQSAWTAASTAPAAPVQGYIQNGQVHVSGSTAVAVPLTVPPGTVQGVVAFGTAYGGEQSAWIRVPAGGLVLTLPAAGFYRA